MHSRVSTCVLTFLVMAACAASACDTDDTVDVSLTGPSSTGRFVYILTVVPRAGDTHRRVGCGLHMPRGARST